MTEHLPRILLDATRDTLFMAGGSSLLAALLGLPLGVILVVTQKGHILSCPLAYRLLSFVVNVTRAAPFVILMIYMIPVTRLLVGTWIGSPKVVIPPLTAAAAPFVARLAESILLEINHGVIEAAQSAGATPWQIIWKVLLPESRPGLMNALTITIISIIGYSTMASVVGGGGLGAVAISYGVNRYSFDIMTGTVIILIAMVMGIQALGDRLARRFDRRGSSSRSA